MKKIASLLLAALMVATLASCGDSEETPAGSSGASSDNGGSSAVTTTENTPASTSADPGNTPESTEGDTDTTPTTPAGGSTLILVSPTATYKYRVFSAPYSAGGAGGEYDPAADELADYMSGLGWNLGDAELPADALNDIKAFEDEAQGPFGDCDVSRYWDENEEPLSNNADVDWAGDNHGLILYTTFNIENLEQFKEQYEELLVYFWYDNTPSVYLNGKLVLYRNTELTGNPGDWVDNFDLVDPGDVAFEPLGDDTLMDRLVQGENTLVIVMKDAWGGRECCFEIDAEP